MQIYVIQQLGYEYNDEYYRQPNMKEDVGSPIKAYRSRQTAERECLRLNKEGQKTNHMVDCDNEPIEELFIVVEIQCDEKDVSYEEAKELLDQARKVQVDKARELFMEETKELFEAHDQLQSFSWQQYTNYFNDGDACYFSVYAEEGSLKINEESTEDMDNGEECVDGKWVQVREPDPLLKVADEVTGFIYYFNDSDMEEMFGDHVEVTVCRGGEVGIENCEDHD